MILEGVERNVFGIKRIKTLKTTLYFNRINYGINCLARFVCYRTSEWTRK